MFRPSRNDTGGKPNEKTVLAALREAMRKSSMALFVTLVAGSATALAESTASSKVRMRDGYSDNNAGDNWVGYGRTFGQQHYSPLTQINSANVGRLGLQWFLDLGPENSATQPIAVDGILYFATGLSVVQAVDVVSGKLLWRYDPRVAEKANSSLRLGWGVRGIAWWNNKIYTGTQDGRLIAIDAKSGNPVWSVVTFNRHRGAPRVFDGKVVIGHSGSTNGKDHSYVTAYDAESGRQLWRFWTVPSDRARSAQSPTMAMAAKTWVGDEWVQSGGGGRVWNAIAYDPEIDSVYIGTGSGTPWNRRERSADLGDNLFIASIVALDGTTGAYKWHYQVNPGDTWDYDATMDIELADLTIGGSLRKVLMQAPKNGFFYVIDRRTGQLISAEPFTKVTWASQISLATGRPIENPDARYPRGMTIEVSPSGYGAHNWMPMAYSPKARLAYIPVIENSSSWSDATRGVHNSSDGPIAIRGQLLAWNPVTQRAAWSVPQPTYLNGGVLATGGDLLFQGTVDGTFKAYAAPTGGLLWSFSAQCPILGTPISYAVSGRQYVSVLTGLGMGLASFAGASGERIEQYGIDPRSQARRVLTFALDGPKLLPSPRAAPRLTQDPEFRPDSQSYGPGKVMYERHCILCHGAAVIGSSHAPDLRRSIVPLTSDAFAGVVRNGALVVGGMPAFPELTDAQLADLRQYIRTESARLRARSSTEHSN